MSVIDRDEVRRLLFQGDHAFVVENTRTIPRWILGATACLCAVGCLPRARINAACRWTGDASTLGPAGDLARRAHMTEDVRVAKDLGIRYADASAERMPTPAWQQARAWCTERSIAEIMAAHGVSPEEVAVAAGTRELWIDMLAVFLPAALSFLVASTAFVGRVVAGYDHTDDGVAAVVLSALTPLAGGVAVVLTQTWSVLVEQLRLRDEHISYRTFELPANRHGWLLWSIAMALFAGVSAVAVLRRREPTLSQRRANL